MSLLYFFVLIPIVMMVMFAGAKNSRQTNIIAFSGSVSLIGMSFYLLFDYLKQRAQGLTDEMLYVNDVVWYKNFNIHFNTGVDGISVLMILLSSIIVFAAYLVAWKNDLMKKEFFILFAFLSAGAYGFFISLDLFTMFFFLEMSVVPKFLLIAVWGSGKKSYSAMKLALMLMAGSVFVLFGILGIYYGTGAVTLDIMKLAQLSVVPEWQNILFLSTFIGFGIIGAMFPFHNWVPDGHSSAPTPVSMFLSGISMKLGAYGAYRVAIFLLPAAAKELSWIFLILAAFSVVYGAFAALAQKDLKYINAYASISHCGLIFFAFLLFNATALTGAFMQIVSHGLITALFFAVIGMIYSRTHTRLITEMGGLMKVMPFIGVAFMLGGLASLGLPGFSGFIAEMTVFVGAFAEAGTLQWVLTVFATTTIVITAVYILRAVGKVMFGPVQDAHHLSLTDATWWEKTAVVTLVLSSVVMGVLPFWMNDMFYQSVLPLVTKMWAFN